MNAAHCAGVSAAWPSFIVSTLGASTGNQTSYQLPDENCAFGTPRGGRRTVPMRSPSFAVARGTEPNDTNGHCESGPGDGVASPDDEIDGQHA